MIAGLFLGSGCNVQHVEHRVDRTPSPPMLNIAAGNCAVRELGPIGVVGWDDAPAWNDVSRAFDSSVVLDLVGREDMGLPPTVELDLVVETTGDVEALVFEPFEDWPPVCVPGRYAAVPVATWVDGPDWTGRGEGLVVWNVDDPAQVFLGDTEHMTLADSLASRVSARLEDAGCSPTAGDWVWKAHFGDGYLTFPVNFEDGSGAVTPWPGGYLSLWAEGPCDTHVSDYAARGR